MGYKLEKKIFWEFNAKETAQFNAWLTVLGELGKASFYWHFVFIFFIF